MKRRDFITCTLGLAAMPRLGFSVEDAALTIMTVRGPIAPEEMGTTLPHEHVLVDFIGADQVSRERYDADEVYKIALPFLNQVKDLGCRTLVECTPAYIGRDPELLRQLSEASGMHLLTNTGYYGAADDKFVPQHAYEETADQLAERWIREWNEGIEGTGIKPGFIKIGVDSGKLSEIDRKLVLAAARTHLQTGLTIAAHTGNGPAALDEINVLKEEGVAGQALIWVHAQNENNKNVHLQAAQAGAWIEFDNLAADSSTRNLENVVALRDEGHLAQVLLSHDAGWYHVGEPGGGNFVPYTYLFQEFIPALKSKGFSDDEVDQLIQKNPQKAFSIGVRKAETTGIIKAEG